MFEAHTAIEISAPIAAVWPAMLDFSAYKNWNPFVVDVVGPARPLQVGDDFLLHVAWADGKRITSGERATRIEPPHAQDGAQRADLGYRFTGWLHALNLIRANRLQSLEQKAGGPTVYTSREVMTGLIAKYAPLALVQEGFERHARALKHYAEKG